MKITVWLLLLGACLIGVGQPVARAQSPEANQRTTPAGPLKLVIPQGQAYSGAYIDFGEREDEVTLEAIERFDNLVHKQQAIIAFSSDWGNESFPDKQLRIIASYGAVPLVYWSPWDRPVGGKHPPAEGRFNLNTILAGQWDSYIDLWATHAKAFGKPLFVSWALEMNGAWFPWSGLFYGKGQPVEGCDGCFAGPETFKKAYRYVVDRVRSAGATNILWVWHANNTSDPDEPWNVMAHYYPGPQYADWLAISAYGTQYPSEDWITVEMTMTAHYRTLCKEDETKPLMLAEWGVGEFPKKGDKAQWITKLLTRIPKDYPRFRAAVFWHERWQNGDQSFSNLRVNSSAAALDAYQQGISDRFWLARPLFTP
jgi:hypothetical protein